jgi:hypothetical protein
MSRTVEMVLGMIGGILGICAALFGVLVGGVATAMEVESGALVSGASWLAMLFSILGIVGAAMVKSKTRMASIFMIVAAVVGFLCISFFYLLPTILLLIAGIMGLVRKAPTAV